MHEIFWHPWQVGIEGEDDLPVFLTAGSVVSLASLYNSDEQRHVAILGTQQGKITEIFWKSDTVGVEGHDDLPVDFPAGSIVGLSGFYDRAKQRHVVAVGLTDGTVHQIYWKATTAGIEAHSVVARFPAGTIMGIAGYFSDTDSAEHIIVGLSNGSVEELWTVPDV